ncbi:hypothetical protein SteCoe_4386 [Stentor coeruleus]|uniref:BRCT domain-containing protein n=1 Tax=Stentor coeruleus TaxID=5963 RepID=A0A1R2CUR6_9CILI|nr:hypothetical protein SteCoe_4386 [Stentor coeruleus]
MSSIVICASGFSPSEKSVIENMVLELGGIFEDDLTTSASVLIAKRQGTLKSTTSSEVLKIPVVTEKWLHDSYRKKSFIKSFHKYKLPLLEGLKIWTYKLDKGRKKKIKKCGGILSSHQSKECYCIITEPEYQKLLQLCIPDMKITNTQWLDKIIEEKKWVDPGLYLIANFEPKEQELYLAHWVFFIEDLDEEENKVIKEIIILGGGTYVNVWHDMTTHVITNDCKKNYANAVKITPKKFMESCLNKSLKA